VPPFALVPVAAHAECAEQERTHSITRCQDQRQAWHRRRRLETGASQCKCKPSRLHGAACAARRRFAGLSASAPWRTDGFRQGPQIWQDAEQPSLRPLGVGCGHPQQSQTPLAPLCACMSSTLTAVLSRRWSTEPAGCNNTPGNAPYYVLYASIIQCMCKTCVFSRRRASFVFGCPPRSSVVRAGRPHVEGRGTLLHSISMSTRAAPGRDVSALLAFD
jgi:hypothetical protein